MTDRKALAAALDKPLTTANASLTITTAARERLAQLPEKCGTCKGDGYITYGDDGAARNCDNCHGSGKVYPAEFRERMKQAVILGMEKGKEGYANAVNVDVVTGFVLDALNGETE